MDPIDAITKITSGVLRRIADAIDTAPTIEPTVTIHIETLHVHHSDSATVARNEKVGVNLRTRVLGRS